MFTVKVQLNKYSCHYRRCCPQKSWDKGKCLGKLQVNSYVGQQTSACHGILAMMMDDGFVSLGFNVLLLQSQLDIPFKVRAGHIGEDITVPICHLLSLFATFPLIRIGVLFFSRPTAAKDSMEEPLQSVSRGETGWRLSARSPNSK